MTLTKILLLVAPLLLSPLFVLGSQYLFPTFLREGARIFLAMDLPGSLARKVGIDLAVRTVVILVLCWMAGYGCLLLGLSLWFTIGFGIFGVFLAMLGTITLCRGRLAIRSFNDAMLVGLIAFAGGNLPIFVLVPLALLGMKLFAWE